MIGAPLDLGAGAPAASTWGRPRSATRVSANGSRGSAIVCPDLGNVDGAARETPTPVTTARYLADRGTCERVAARVAEAVRRGLVPLVLGGDHSIALGTLGGMASVHGPAACSGSMPTAT